MRLYLINPRNPLVSLADVKHNRWNRYRVWKPLGLLVLAGLTPAEWEITVFDENIGAVDFDALPRPDLVGITAFTSQAPRAYELADSFRQQAVPVVMGGIHATMCAEEAGRHVDAIVAGEAESVWPTVLEDVQAGRLKRFYHGRHVDMAEVPQARHDLLAKGYAIGSVQTTRGCPLDCTFCSVSAFNGKKYRHRPIDEVIRELQSIRETWVLVVDDNLIGTSKAHIERAKDLFRAIIRARLGKHWICQVTINMADDEELLDLAARAGCRGVFIGFESVTPEGLAEVGKKFNLARQRDMVASVKNIQKHRILVVGSFILGLDVDQPGIGLHIAAQANHYGVDLLNALFLTPLPGTRLWDQCSAEHRIAANHLPDDWRYYTLGFPTARYRHLSHAEIIQEMIACERRFYSVRQIATRVLKGALRWRRPLLSLVASLGYRNNNKSTHRMFRDLPVRLRGT
jgi:radical SAM superfamily enzyme YgiQ (UPF0313 family)